MLQPFHLAIPVDDLQLPAAFMVSCLAVKKVAAVITGSTTTFSAINWSSIGTQR